MKRIGIIVLVALICVTSVYAAGKSETKGDKVVDIEFFSLKPEAIDTYEQLVKKFNEENPDVHVTLTSTADAQTVFLTRVSTNTVPECNYVFATAIYKELMKEGLFVDLSNDPLLDLVEKGILEMAKVEGKNYSVPVTLSPSGIYYNIDLFAKHGYAMPDTYEELIQLCNRMLRDGIQPFAFSDKDAHTIGQQAERFIGGNINPNIIEKFELVGAGKSSWTIEPEMRQLAELMLELRKYGPADNLGMSHEQAIADFVNQKVAMIISGTWAASTINQAKPTFKYEMVPFPSFRGAEVYLSTSPDTCYAISATASPEKQAAARRFIEFLLSKESIETWLKNDFSPNMAKNIDYSVEFFEKTNAVLAEGKMTLLPSMLQPAGFRVDWQVAVQQLLLDKNIDAFLQKSDQITTSFYKR